METSRVEIEGAQIVGHVQADAFCEGCGYNLHTQAVTRDERLGILICRCPECGRFAAAASLTPVRHIWLNRLGLGLLIAWILFLLFVFAMLTIFHGVVANGNALEVVAFEPIPPAPASTTYLGYHYVLRERPQNDNEAYRRRVEEAMLAAVALLLGALAGGVVSVCMWHVRRWVRLVAFLPAAIGVGIAYTSFINDPMTKAVAQVAYGRMSFTLLVECVGVVLGLWLGRPIARAALTIILPPKPRQHLAFLWTTDGKQVKL